MTKRNIKAVSFIDPPYVYPCFINYGSGKTDQCNDPGIDVELLYDQLVRLGFNVHFMMADNISHMYWFLKKGYADISASLHDISTLEDKINLSATIPAATNKIHLLVKQPSANYVPNLLVYKFHWSVWLLCFVMFLFVCFYKTVVRYCYYKLMPGDSLKDNRIVHSCPMIFWSVCFGILLSIYSQNLTIALFLTSGKAPFNDRHTLHKQLKTGNCRFVLDNYYKPKSTLEIFPFLTDDEEQFITFNNSLQKQSILIGEYNEIRFVKKITEQRCNIGLLNSIAAKKLLVRRDGLHVIDLPEMPETRWVYVYRNSFWLKNRLNLLNPGGITTMYENYHRKYDSYLAALNSNETTALENIEIDGALQLFQLLDTIWFWFAGLVISFLTFLIQWLWKKVSRRRKSQKKDAVTFFGLLKEHIFTI